MISYSIDSDVRATAFRFCAGFSIAVSLFVNYFLFPLLKQSEILNDYAQVFIWLDQIGIIGQLTPFALFGLFWFLFDKYVWKLKWIVKIHGLPNLNGQWDGTATSNYRDESGKPYKYDMKLKITQSFTRMSCVSKFEHSESDGSVIGLTGCKDGDGRYSLSFSYRNAADDSFVSVDSWPEYHEGFNTITCEGNHMNGHYFTNKDPATHGTFTLERRQ